MIVDDCAAPRSMWLTSDGRAATSRTPAAPRRPGPLRTARWIAAPATWPGRSSPRALAAALTRRVVALPAVYRPAPLPAIADDEPAGYLESAPGDGLLPLYSAHQRSERGSRPGLRRGHAAGAISSPRHR